MMSSSFDVNATSGDCSWSSRFFCGGEGFLGRAISKFANLSVAEALTVGCLDFDFEGLNASLPLAGCYHPYLIVSAAPSCYSMP